MSVTKSIQGVKLYDANGNVLPVLEGDAIGASDYGLLVAGLDPDDNAKFLELDANGRIRVVSQAEPGEIAKRIFSPLEDASSNTNLYVDGSVTPVTYTYDAHATEDVYITQIRFVINASDIQFKEGSGSGTFHKLDALTNGVKLEVRSDSTTIELANLKRDEEFLAFGGNDIFDQTGTSDLLTATYDSTGIVLMGGSADFVKVTIRDNLENAGHIFFGCWVKGFRV